MYYTVLIPWVPAAFRTEWHPLYPDGPFKVLSRGAFPTLDEAITWGRTHLNGTPYTVREVDA